MVQSFDQWMEIVIDFDLLRVRIVRHRFNRSFHFFLFKIFRYFSSFQVTHPNPQNAIPSTNRLITLKQILIAAVKVFI